MRTKNHEVVRKRACSDAQERAWLLGPGILKIETSRANDREPRDKGPIESCGAYYNVCNIVLPFLCNTSIAREPCNTAKNKLNVALKKTLVGVREWSRSTERNRPQGILIQVQVYDIRHQSLGSASFRALGPSGLWTFPGQ